MEELWACRTRPRWQVDVQRGGEDLLQAHDIIHGVSLDVIRLRKSLGRQTERTLRVREVH